MSSGAEFASRNTVVFGIRSHKRPTEALSTFMLLRSLGNDELILVFVADDEQVAEYRAAFGVFADRIRKGAQGSGHNVWSIVQSILENLPIAGLVGLVVTDDNLTGIRSRP